MDGDRRGDSGANARASTSPATATATSSSPRRCIAPYRVGRRTRTVACGFRDHALSDLIGFTYASWAADAAADDFVRRLVEAGRPLSARGPAGKSATIFVILDGENAWEHYEGRAGRSSGRCTAGSDPIPSCGP